MKGLHLFFAFGIFMLLLDCSPKNFEKTYHTMDPITNNSYDSSWTEVSRLDSESLPKSALKVVEEIYHKAKQENNPSQIVKSLIYKSTYINKLEEEGLAKAINQMRLEIDNSKFPTKQILMSVVAEMYNKYYKNNDYLIRQRTKIQDHKPNDILTWSTEDFNLECQALYLKSVELTDLRNISIEEFKAITYSGDVKYRPNLYDFLAHRAIDYFMDDRSFITEPVYQFYVDQAEAFGASQEFVNYKFESKDTHSNKLHILHVFQSLERIHLKDKAPAALFDVQTKRLLFVKNNSIHPSKEQFYLSALNQLIKKYEGKEEAAEAHFLIAEYYLAIAEKYTGEKGDANKDGLKKVHAICTSTIEKYPSTFGANECKNLKTRIEKRSLSLTAERVNPKAPFLLQVKYTNAPKIWLRAIPLTEKIEMKIEQIHYVERAAFIFKLKAKKSWTQVLPSQDDYREHSTEVSIELPYGKYIILGSDQENFGKTTIAHYVEATVSDLAYITAENNQGGMKFIVVDRTTGEPRKNVKAIYYGNRYDKKKKEYRIQKVGKGKSDKNGFIYFKGGKDDGFFTVKLIKGKDELFLDNDFYDSPRFGESEGTKTHLFLDRGIYRPGQTVYFKGILVHNNGNKPSIRTNESIDVSLLDANAQSVSSLVLVSNEYGSVSGHFVLPSSGRLGRMYLQASDGSTVYFRVEEYKRPKFEVSFKPIKESYRLNDLIKVSGFAKAFAGNNIDGAKVKYKVTRLVHYPYRHWNSWSHTPATQIGSGTTKTNTEGQFDIEFKAVPDLNLDKNTQPVFIYSIHADIVDITGETHSASTIVSVGYVALFTEINLLENNHTDSLKSISFSTYNLSGVFAKATGNIKIVKLVSPNKTFIERRWSAPDSPILSKEDYEKDYPFFAFGTEDQPENWAHEKTVLEEAFDSEVSKKVVLREKLAAGKYLIVLDTKDKYGQPLKTQKIFTVYDLETVPNHDFAWAVDVAASYEPGDEAVIHYGTSIQRRFLISVEKKNKLVKEQWTNTDGIFKLTFPIKKEDRGGFYVSINSVAHNRINTSTFHINVPHKNKELKIEYTTFRDKLLPGAQEEWSLKISGSKKDKVAAEMVATLYDASLDKFSPNHWWMNLYPNFGQTIDYRGVGFGSNSDQMLQDYMDSGYSYGRGYHMLNWFDMEFYQRRSRFREMASPIVTRFEKMKREDKISHKNKKTVSKPSPKSDTKEKDNNSLATDGHLDEPIKVRTNLKETVFFFPNLKTDKDGNVIIKFTMNEALTRWKFMGLAHTKDLKVGMTTNTVVTQKDLMIVPNPPRFFREGDQIEFTAKVSNLTEKEMKGTAKLELFDAISMQPVDILLGNAEASQSFTAAAGQSAPLTWKITIPKGKVMSVTHRVTARAGNHTDGEESSLPVLTNRMLVTETMAMSVRENSKKTFTLRSLAENNSTTLANHKYTLEFTSNPAWYAVQAMPYMMEFPHECTEQTFNRYFANSLGTSLSKQHPKIQRVFEQWKNSDALLSNLSKNQELKTALLEETPWVLEAQSEAQQKKNIGLLFDLNKMQSEQAKALGKIFERQMGDGGFSWFPGGKTDWYITQYLVEGFGHLRKLEGGEPTREESIIIDKALGFIDIQLEAHYNNIAKLVKKGKTNWTDSHLDNSVIHYLYARSFFLNKTSNLSDKKILEYYLAQAEKYWKDQSFYMRGMIALALQRYDRPSVPKLIVASLKEHAIVNEEMGMYFKSDAGYWWYQLPIETHTILIEMFDEVAKDAKAVNDMKVWLLKNKQTNRWSTTKSTAAAVYVLLSTGENWLESDQPVQISIGNGKHDAEIKAAQAKAEVGTGHFKIAWDGKEINKDFAQVTINNTNKVVSWGSVYWQYFEDLDKITTFEETPLKLKKEVFKVVETDNGSKLVPVNSQNKIHPGDLLKIRIELRADRDMEYIHMKDMRASGFEPLNVISQYKWQDGLGYYESTGDVATNFFIDYLPKGTYVFEYPVRVIHRGDFSNGVTTIQSMYAPEFSSHSAGIRLKVL